MTQTANIGLSSSTALDAAATAKAQERASLEKAAKGFEAIFMRQLMTTMRGAGENLGESIDGSSAVDQFQEMSDANMANSLAGSNGGGGLGIAQMILKQLDKH